MEERYRTSSRSNSRDEPRQGFIEHLSYVFRRVIIRQNSQRPRADSEQSHPERVKMSGIAQSSSTDPEQTDGGNDINQKNKVRLLLCIDKGRSRTILRQEVLQNITSDFELFDHLHKHYCRKSRWLTVRCVGMVSLAQVSLMDMILTDCFLQFISSLGLTLS